MDEVEARAEEAEAHIPEGYEDLEEFLEEARKRFQEGVDADRENRDAGLEDLRFQAGEQWDEGVKAARVAKGRPCLTINTLPQYVGQVVGDTRMNRPAIRVRPAEAGDKTVAEVRQGLIRFIENRSNASLVYALAGEDQVGGGLGHFRVGLEYTNDDAFDQDIRIRHVPNPFSVVWDPLSVDPTGADARWCFVVDEMDRAAFEAAYPEARTSSLTVPVDREGWISRDVVRVTEYWMIKETARTIALMVQPPEVEPVIVDITGREEEAAPYVVQGADGRPRTRQVMKRSACMYLTNGHELLDPQPYEYPISRLPIFKVTGREIRVGARRYRFGLVRFAKDPIRMKNLWRSSAAEYLGAAPKQQWLLHASDEDQARQYRNAGKSGDTVLTWSGQSPPQRIDPPTAPSALLQEAQFNDQDIQDVTGLHDASLGMRSNETSGRAIMARERQGDVATFIYHDNLSLSIRECGQVVNELIPVVYDTPRTLVVLGEDGVAQARRVNDPAHMEFNPATGRHEPAFIDLKTGKYDILVETGPSYSTKRVEAADSMMQFVQAVPQAAAIAGDLIAEAQDWPNAEAFAKRLRKMLPPGVAAAEGPRSAGPPAPDPRAQAQMQQHQAQMAAHARAQQLAEQRAQMELAEQQAKIAQARAGADKAAADARRAQAEAQAAEMAVGRGGSFMIQGGADGLKSWQDVPRSAMER